MDSGIDLKRLLQQEDASVEWKQNADIERVVKTLSAFANNFTGLVEGGWVVCGIAEDKDEHGFPRPHRVGLEASRFKEVKGRVLTLCRERISPPVVPIVTEQAVEGDPARRILAFYVAASPYIHAVRTSDGSSTYWVRTGSETVEARGELLRELRRRKQDAPPILEQSAPGATLEDIDRFAAEEFLKSANLPLDADEYFKPGARLDAFSFPLVVSQPVSPGESKAIPTHLATLLFSREPTRFLHGAYALFSVYGGAIKS
jgi:ATP-dependent DNA helicase RecG